MKARIETVNWHFPIPERRGGLRRAMPVGGGTVKIYNYIKRSWHGFFSKEVSEGDPHSFRERA